MPRVTQAADLRARSEALAGALPALLAGAERLAAAVQPGLHGRRRPGPGEAFWQYRPAQPSDGLRGVDWRRSGRGDDMFARQHEWQVAQSLQVWVDPTPRMGFGTPDKATRATELALALAILAERGGERIGLPGQPPRAGAVALGRVADALAQGCADLPKGADFCAHGRAVLFSDALGDLAPLEATLADAAARGVRGVLCQVLAAEETGFPYRGRVIFEGMGDETRHETLRADALRDAYLARLAERRAALAALTARVGWQFVSHDTQDPAADTLIWLARAVERPQ